METSAHGVTLNPPAGPRDYRQTYKAAPLAATSRFPCGPLFRAIEAVKSYPVFLARASLPGQLSPCDSGNIHASGGTRVLRTAQNSSVCSEFDTACAKREHLGMPQSGPAFTRSDRRTEARPEISPDSRWEEWKGVHWRSLGADPGFRSGGA